MPKPRVWITTVCLWSNEDAEMPTIGCVRPATWLGEGRRGTPSRTAETDRFRMVAVGLPRRDYLPHRSSGAGQWRECGVRHVPCQGGSASPCASPRIAPGNSKDSGCVSSAPALSCALLSAPSDYYERSVVWVKRREEGRRFVLSSAPGNRAVLGACEGRELPP